MRNKVQLLAKQFHDVYDGAPWYGDSARSKLATLDPALATLVIADLGRSVSQVVAHLTAYQRFAIARLRDSTEFAVPLNSTVDWPELRDVMNWEEVYQAFTETQQELHALILDNDDEMLNKQVPGKDYDFQFLLDGIVQHAAYHLGQIGILLRLAMQQQDGDD
jgi:uncharacterized damage-inducible protein DinB